MKHDPSEIPRNYSSFDITIHLILQVHILHKMQEIPDSEIQNTLLRKQSLNLQQEFR